MFDGLSENGTIIYNPKLIRQEIQNLFPVCLKCQKPVFIKNIMDNKEVKIKIDCEYCQNSQMLTIDEYINQLNSLLPHFSVPIR